MSNSTELMLDIFLDEETETVVITIGRATFALCMSEFMELCSEIDSVRDEVVRNSGIVKKYSSVGAFGSLFFKSQSIDDDVN